MQGNLEDPLYFDFISFTQAAAASKLMATGLQVGVQYQCGVVSTREWCSWWAEQALQMCLSSCFMRQFFFLMCLCFCCAALAPRPPGV